ncbi:regulation of nuclear pre-mRNA domain-containing protein 1B-like isoform X1 [Haliotis rufescens]|uniref:regulation of nuclear pre-mRNA domain-containing protein 1B-like isoform X1 n=1 Tax=Haliotis rufescens TaxID=6454 RepID=UPI00201F9F76|nr:regulation of nuclear pre-mRNA domain-containing protein 1B-like isoform X1 [Haliotis rufescens]
MSSFSDSNFSKKLFELNNTQQSIQTLSLWLIHHRKHSKTIVQVWHREIMKGKTSKKLTFFYLANDVIQNSKKKGPEFTRDFATVLPDAVRIASKDADDKTKRSLERVLNIWQERGVYVKEFIRSMKHQLTSKSTPTVVQPEPVQPAVKKKKHDQHFLSLREEVEAMEPLPIPPDADNLIKRLSDLESSASSDAAVREKIAALPQEVSDISHLDKIQGKQDKESADRLSKQVESACMLLSDYNQRLNSELEERKKVARMLHDFIQHQRECLTEAENRMTEYKGKLAKVTTVRQELKSHLQNLPDLTLLPDVTGGLAPLPSAGDLFSL